MALTGAGLLSFALLNPGCSSSGSDPAPTSDGGLDATASDAPVSSTDGSSGGDVVVTPTDGATGGPVTGAADTHCTEADGGKIVQATNAGSCAVTGDAGTEELPGPMFNAEADDDDCKYHVKWSITPIQVGKDATVTVTVTKRTDGSPLTGASPNAELFLSDTHPAPNTAVKTTETAAGTYTIGPVQFDASGQWTMRFHFFETCTDVAEDSPHGHAAFWVAVP
ncbi:MAG: FixH family protein [Polyangiaceae bacterium]